MSRPKELKEGIFLRRVNRFLALVRVDREQVGVHVPNSGRRKELLLPGNPVILQRALTEGRKTSFDLVMVRLAQGYVSIDARLPNSLFHETLMAKKERHNAGAIFVVQRADASSFSPNQETDPVFARAMFSAFQNGIRFYAYTCDVKPGEVRLLRQIPVVL